VNKRMLGTTGRDIGALGLGCKGMSWGYQESARDDSVSRSVIKRAVDLGVDMVDTAAVYGDGHNEKLVGEVVGNRGDVVVATKGGLVVDDLGTRTTHCDGRPESLRLGIRESR
jgi:aryl-alcohol dehydrogenase-like predicted oxidoreductase